MKAVMEGRSLEVFLESEDSWIDAEIDEENMSFPFPKERYRVQNLCKELEDMAKAKDEAFALGYSILTNKHTIKNSMTTWRAIILKMFYNGIEEIETVFAKSESGAVKKSMFIIKGDKDESKK
jgi:hypothetical protein